LNLLSDLGRDSQKREVVDGEVLECESVVAVGDRLAAENAAVADYQVTAEDIAIDHGADFWGELRE
jgi:hypothetical protein